MFPCTKCGLCCQNIAHIPELKKFDLGNGVCKYYDAENKLCKIYENRPDICRVDKMYDLEYHKYFTRKEFYIENAKVCNMLQELAGVDKSYRVRIDYKE
jgi:Fe-S-cluster containining protein